MSTAITSAPSTFRYRAVDGSGRRVRGVAEAANEAALARELEARGLLVIDVATASPSAVAGASAGSSSRAELLEATRAIAALLAAGVPLARALTIAASIVPPRMARTLDELRASISTGAPLSVALASRPRLFSPMYRGVVRAGERSGALADAFASLVEQLEGEARLRARLLSATIYPALLAIAGLITVGVLVLFVLPRFAELLADAHASLPRSTAALLAASRWLRTAWLPLIVVLVACGAAAATVPRTTRGARALASLLVRLPLVGSVRRNMLAARFARLLVVLLRGGAPLLLALDDSIDSLADPLARDEVARVRSRVREGRSLHAALAEGELFPPLLARLTAVGEESGALVDFLQRSAEMAEGFVDRLLQRLVTFVEPALIAAFGLLIAFVALSLLQAIYGVDATSFR